VTASAPGSRPVALWLLTGVLLIAAMVTIGGVTRLTGSGLSITEWNVIMGALPRAPRQTGRAVPEVPGDPSVPGRQPHFALEDFKSIFWWEYITAWSAGHSAWCSSFPFVVFLVRGWLDRPLRRKVLLILALGLFQGVLGWFMVASGLSERTSVSHYRLAAHLLTALVTLGRDALGGPRPPPHDHTPRPAPTALRAQVRVFTALVALQTLYGALVAGLKAGFAYNTFPLMGGRWVPDGAWQLVPRWLNLVENPATVQFVHRTLAWTLAVFGIWLWHTLRVHGVRRRGNLLLVALALQFSLGILTILRLPSQPVLWGASHQAGAVALPDRHRPRPARRLPGPALTHSPLRTAMLVVTTNALEGHRITRHLGIVTGEAILGANLFKDLFAGIRDIVGGRSGAYEQELRKARDLALSEMCDEASALGANAVVAVDVDYETIQVGAGGGMLMVTAAGTAVVTD